ncbi:MAG TPA: hypothetical protein VEQ63_12565 [Bryobacteraceae bacterium]|nr:hypothetical protein [Bryobacteraceae bacterium]
MARYLLAILTAAAACPAEAPVAADIVNRALSADRTNFERIRNYTMVENRLEQQLDGSGNVKSSKRNTYDILFIEGKRYDRRIARDGKPLSAEDDRKEQKKLEEFSEKQRERSARDRAKDIESERRERAELMSLLPSAFDFHLRGEEVLDGRQVYKIDAVRRPGFKPKNKKAEVFSKLQGTLWIDSEEYIIVRADVEIMEPVSFGFFIAKLSPGARVKFEQTRVNNEVWLPKLFDLRADVRILGKQNRLHAETQMSNYRKFSAESKVLSVSEPE